jgi:hypothetical protein
MYDFTSEPADPPEVKALLRQAKQFYNEATKLRNGNKAAALAKAISERKRGK